MSAAQGARPSLMRRVALFVSKPYLDWSQTAYPLSNGEDESLRSAFTTQRISQLDAVQRNRDLQRLRLKLLQHPVSRYADGMPRREATTVPQVSDAPEAFEDFAQTQPMQARPAPLPATDADLGIAVGTLEDAGSVQGTLDTAALAFANGDAVAAEDELLQALNRFPKDAALIYANLLDLFRATLQHDKFAAAAHLLSRSTGRPAPLWSRPRPASVANAEPQPVPRHALVTTMQLDAAQATRLLNHVNGALSAGQAYCLDFRAVHTVEDRACWPLAALFNRLANLSGEVQVAGLLRLGAALARPFGPGEPPCDRLRARLALARLNGDAQAYAAQADEFQQHCKLPAPEWAPPRCVLVLPPHVRVATAGATLGTLRVELAGVLKRATLEALLDAQGEGLRNANQIELDAAALRRIDFEAATALVNWAREQSARGLPVHATQLNHLHLRLLETVGACGVIALQAHSHYA